MKMIVRFKRDSEQSWWPNESDVGTMKETWDTKEKEHQ